MKIKVKQLLLLLEKSGMTGADLAREMSVDMSEIEKLLNGEKVCVNTAKKFIGYIGADIAQGLIDWDALGKKNPLAGEVSGNNDEGEL